ncbi:MAG: hypothetical protein AAGJ32_10850 [Pseudomonadota bacterium]
MDDSRYSSRTDSDTERFGRWIRKRPAESWMFFTVGLFLGSFFL